MLVNRKAEEDFVKVLDFGISKDLDLAAGDNRVALTRPDVAIGTPVYMSPEQAAGRPADALTDVYAIGGLLYEMLTGCPPCAGTDAIDVLHKKAHEDPVAIGSLRPDLPPEVERLVTRALSRRVGGGSTPWSSISSIGTGAPSRSTRSCTRSRVKRVREARWSTIGKKSELGAMP